MSQAPISINGKEVIDLSLRNCQRESIKGNISIKLPIDQYTELLSLIGKIPTGIELDEDGYISCICKGKYRYIYNTGGHMVKHIDTIKSETHIGTLIIIEKKPIKGGNLVIDPYSAKYKYFESRLEEDSFLEKVLIPIGIPHEVTPIEQGIRISKVYEIHISEGSDIEGKLYTQFPIDTYSERISSFLPMSKKCSISEYQFSPKWDKSLAYKYTKGNRYVAFPSDPDPIECLILLMIIETYGLKTYTKDIITLISSGEDEAEYMYGYFPCTLIGDKNSIGSYSRYNDDGYDHYSYILANIIEIPK